MKVAGAGPVAEVIREIPGQGVTGTIDGRRAKIGSASFFGAMSDGGSELWFAFEGEAPTPFHFDDAIRPDAAETIAKLKAMGIEVELLSGDGAERVARAAEAAGIQQWTARATPQSTTVSAMPLARENTLTAAPPARKFSTICQLTSCGKADTPRATRP